MYCYGANSQSQNQSTLKTRNTFNATAPAPTNSANIMRATKVDSERPQARNAALIAKRVRCIPLHKRNRNSVSHSSVSTTPVLCSNLVAASQGDIKQSQGLVKKAIF